MTRPRPAAGPGSAGIIPIGNVLVITAVVAGLTDSHPSHRHGGFANSLQLRYRNRRDRPSSLCHKA